MFISAQMSLLDYNSQTAINFKRVLKDAMFDVSGTSFPFGVSMSSLQIRHIFVATYEWGMCPSPRTLPSHCTIHSGCRHTKRLLPDQTLM